MNKLVNYCVGMFCAILVAQVSSAQNNGLVRYNALSGTTDFIKAVNIDTNKSYNNTSFSLGNLSDVADLHIRKSLSHEPGSGFTDINIASSWFKTSSYPARTAVKLFYYRSGTLHELCSGTLIADNMVVTSAHCIYYYFDDSDLVRNWVDSILVIPSYNNSTVDPDIGRAISTKFYVFENWYNEIDLDYDMALIELDKPIGKKAGWIGIGYNEQNEFYTNNVFHNFSYPSAMHPFDSTRIYDGNVLYYSYGLLDTVAKYEIGHKVNAIPGQSGSSVLYSDNRSYHIYGVLSNHLYGNGTLFNKITSSKFYAIKNLLENQTSISDNKELNTKESFSAIKKIPLHKNQKLVGPKTGNIVPSDFLHEEELNRFKKLPKKIRKKKAKSN